MTSVRALINLFPGFESKEILVTPLQEKENHEFQQFLLKYTLGSDFDSSFSSFEDHLSQLKSFSRNPDLLGFSLYLPTFGLRVTTEGTKTFFFSARLKRALAFDEEPTLGYSSDRAFDLSKALSLIGDLTAVASEVTAPHKDLDITPVAYEYFISCDSPRMNIEYSTVAGPLSLQRLDSIAFSRFELGSFGASAVYYLPNPELFLVEYVPPLHG